MKASNLRTRSSSTLIEDDKLFVIHQCQRLLNENFNNNEVISLRK